MGRTQQTITHPHLLMARINKAMAHPY